MKVNGRSERVLIVREESARVYLEQLLDLRGHMASFMDEATEELDEIAH